MAFPKIINQAGKKAMDIILVPASDWKEMSPIAIKTAVIRGIENGCSVVRQTNMGISYASDAQGKVLSRNNYYTSDRLTMVSEVPTKGRFTLYPYIGNVLPWACMIGIILFMIYDIKSRRESSN